MKRQEIVQDLLANPDKLLMKKPFYREVEVRTPSLTGAVDVGGKVSVKLPSIRFVAVDQSQYLQELNVNCHKVLTDSNIPSVCVKTQNNGFYEIEEVRIALP